MDILLSTGIFIKLLDFKLGLKYFFFFFFCSNHMSQRVLLLLWQQFVSDFKSLHMFLSVQGYISLGGKSMKQVIFCRLSWRLSNVKLGYSLTSDCYKVRTLATPHGKLHNMSNYITCPWKFFLHLLALCCRFLWKKS